MNSPTAVIGMQPDATPLVRSLARTLRASVAIPELRDLAVQTTGVVALKSATDAQSATLTFENGGIQVAHGLADGVDPIELHFDPEYTLAETADPVGQAAAKLLSPPLPSWQDAAAAFWAANRGTRGFPSRLVVVCIDEETEAGFGDGDEVFEIHGYSFVIAAVLSGQGDSFLFAAAVGALAVVGSASQMSVMCGAHWKVRFGE